MGPPANHELPRQTQAPGLIIGGVEECRSTAGTATSSECRACACGRAFLDGLQDKPLLPDCRFRETT